MEPPEYIGNSMKTIPKILWTLKEFCIKLTSIFSANFLELFISNKEKKTTSVKVLIKVMTIHKKNLI